MKEGSYGTAIFGALGAGPGSGPAEPGTSSSRSARCGATWSACSRTSRATSAGAARLPRGAGEGPRIDVSETDSELRIEAELPGVEEKDLEIVLSDGRLTIKGEKKQEKEEKKKDYHLVERSYGSFARSVGLPFAAEPDKIKASFAKGVLTVTVPKPAEVKAKEKKIPIGKG